MQVSLLAHVTTDPRTTKLVFCLITPALDHNYLEEEIRTTA
jgi:hypothetical protein